MTGMKLKPEKPPKPVKGHKGMYSRRESIRLSNLIRDGKASRYHNYTDVESAIEKAGI
jgi:hypothetical protein